MKKILFGIHVNRENNLDSPKKSITKCIQNSILHASSYNLTMNAVSIFISNPRGLQIILKDDELIEFQQWVKSNHILVVAHSSYVAYLWNKEDPDKYIDFVLKEYNVCKQCGIKGLVVHLPKESILKKTHIKQTFLKLIKLLKKDKPIKVLGGVVNDTLVNDTLVTDTLVNDTLVNDILVNDTLVNSTLNSTLVDDTSKIWSVRQELESTKLFPPKTSICPREKKKHKKIGGDGDIDDIDDIGDIGDIDEEINGGEERFAPIIYLETPAITPMWANYDTPKKLSKLFYIIHKMKPNHPFGLCIDTAHIWTSGNDISTYNGAKRWFTELMGAPYIPSPDRIIIHLNDSARELGRGPDKHAPLTHGYIWSKYKTRNEIKKSGLYFILQFAEEYKIPVILERGDKNMLIDDYKILSKII